MHCFRWIAAAALVTSTSFAAPSTLDNPDIRITVDPRLEPVSGEVIKEYIHVKERKLGTGEFLFRIALGSSYLPEEQKADTDGINKFAADLKDTPENFGGHGFTTKVLKALFKELKLSQEWLNLLVDSKIISLECSKDSTCYERELETPFMNVVAYNEISLSLNRLGVALVNKHSGTSLLSDIYLNNPSDLPKHLGTHLGNIKAAALRERAKFLFSLKGSEALPKQVEEMIETRLARFIADAANPTTNAGIRAWIERASKKVEKNEYHLHLTDIEFPIPIDPKSI